MHPWTFYALEAANDRERAEQQSPLPERVRTDSTRDDPSRVRRSVAVALAAVSRGSAAAVRRLDDRTADDLGHSFAP